MGEGWPGLGVGPEGLGTLRVGKARKTPSELYHETWCPPSSRSH